MKKITIEITDDAYEELLEKAEIIKRVGIEKRGNEFTMSTHDIIRSTAELGILPHIKSNMDIIEHNMRNRGVQNE